MQFHYTFSSFLTSPLIYATITHFIFHSSFFSLPSHHPTDTFAFIKTSGRKFVSRLLSNHLISRQSKKISRENYSTNRISDAVKLAWVGGGSREKFRTPCESTMTFEQLETRVAAAMEIVRFPGSGFLKGGHNRPSPLHNRVARFRSSATGLGSAEVNETVNYPGKLSGNSLISG